MNPGSALTSFHTAYANGDFEAAYAHLVAALREDPVFTWHAVVNTCSYGFVKTVGAVAREAEMSALLDSAYNSFPDTICITPQPGDRLALEKIKAQRRKNIERRLPYYLFVAQAKSGSTFLGNIIPQGFSLTCTTYSAIHWQVIPSWARAYRQGGSAYVTHLLPTSSNIKLLIAADLRKIVVNTRDPRQVLLSNLHHLKKYRRDFPEFEKDGFFSLSLNDQALVSLPLYEKYITGWLSGWLAAEASGLEVLFTTYERFMAGRDRQVGELLDFYGGDRRFFDRAAAYATHDSIDYHFRQGTADEWRAVFAPQVIEQLNRFIPEECFPRFGWTE